MSEYGPLADFYDALTRDVNYTAIADWYEEGFARCGNVSSVVDLCCGTGTVSLILAERGYDITAVDASAEMLMVAREKSYEGEYAFQPLFLNQCAQELDLYGTVDAVVCSLDSVNYMAPDILCEAMRRVELFLEPGGVFMFDFNTPHKFDSMDGQVFVDETESVFCVWRVNLNDEKTVCRYDIDIFSKAEKGRWLRDTEVHTEYIYSAAKLEKMLEDIGFVDIERVEALWDKSGDGIMREGYIARKRGEFHN